MLHSSFIIINCKQSIKMSSHFKCGCTKQMYLSPEFLNLLSWLQSNIYYCVYQVKKNPLLWDLGENSHCFARIKEDQCNIVSRSKVVIWRCTLNLPLLTAGLPPDRAAFSSFNTLEGVFEKMRENAGFTLTQD